MAERTRELTRARQEIAAQAEQSRSLLARTFHLQEEERARIAHDMHDGVIQLIAATRYELQAARMAVDAASMEVARSKLNAAREVLEEMEREIRHTIYHLHPPVLDDMGLVPAIQKHVGIHLEPSGVACKIRIRGNPVRLSVPVESAAFRMVEAAVQNIAIHARARSVTVILTYRPTMLTIAVRDDGAGFKYELDAQRHPRSHLGLAGMRERAESLGGEMELRSRPGGGTTVVFRLPLHPEKLDPVSSDLSDSDSAS